MTADNNKPTSGIFASNNNGNNAPKTMTPENRKLSFDDILQSSIHISHAEENLTSSQSLFEGFFDRGQTIVINADNGSGSTWIATEIAVKSSAGQPIFCHYPFVPPANDFEDIVFLFSAGIPVDALKKRISELSGGTCCREKDIYVFAKEDHANTKPIIDLNDLTWFSKFINAIKDIKDKNIILIFDNLDLLITLDQDQNKDEQVEEFYNFVKDLHLNPNVTQVWIDKGSNQPFKIQYPFIDLNIQLKSKQDRGKLAIEVKFLKSNALKKDKTEPIILQLNEYPEAPVMRLELKPADVDKEDLAAVLMISGLTQNDIADRIGVSQSTISILKGKAIERGLIVTKGNNNIATDKGKKLVELMGAYIEC